MKDARGHGSNPRGGVAAHQSGVAGATDMNALRAQFQQHMAESRANLAKISDHKEDVRKAVPKTGRAHAALDALGHYAMFNWISGG